MAHRDSPKQKVLDEGKELGDATRNERQKHLLLQEIGRIRRSEIDAVVGRSKQIIEQSKQLCKSAEPARPAERKRTS